MIQGRSSLDSAVDAFRERKNVVLFSSGLGLFFAVCALVAKRPSWAAGIIAGTVVGLFNFYLLFRDLARVSQFQKELDPRIQGTSFTGRFLVRYLFLAAAFFFVFRSSWIHFLSFVLGFFLIHLILGAFSLIRLLRSAKN